MGGIKMNFLQRLLSKKDKKDNLSELRKWMKEYPTMTWNKKQIEDGLDMPAEEAVRLGLVREVESKHISRVSRVEVNRTDEEVYY